MRDLLLAAIVFGSIPFIFYRPHLGVLVWAWLSYMTPYRYTWSFAYDFRFALVIAVVTLVAWFLSREPKRIPWNLTTISLIAFWAWTSLTTQFAMFPGPAEAKWIELTKIILIDGIVTIALFGDRARLQALLWVIAASIGFYGIKGGIFTLLTGGIYRIGGAVDAYFNDNNLLATALLMTIPLMRYLQLTSERQVARWGLLGAMALSIVAVLGTQSRGGFVGLLVLLFVMFARSRKKLFVGLALGITLFLAVGFMPQKWHDRMATTLTYEEDLSVQRRFQAWAYGLELAQERPVMGGGFKAFLGYEDETGVTGRSAHSIYFQVLGEHGFVGLALYCLLVVSTIVMASSVAGRTKERPELSWAHDLVRMIQTSLIVFAVGGVFLSLAYFELIYHLVAITVAVDAVVRRQLAENIGIAETPIGRRQGTLRHEPTA